MKIVLFDPSLHDNNGRSSNNLGDVIIYEFVKKNLDQMFPGLSVLRIATHTFPSKEIKKRIDGEDLCFLGGTNILNSTVNIYNNWRYDQSFFDTMFSKPLSVVTIGVGWGEYQNEPGFYSKFFYSRRLHNSRIHSVRDSYTASHLRNIRGIKAVNTGCPTTWELNGTTTNRTNGANIKRCVFTLTDYSTDTVKDTELIHELLNHFDEMLLFPQGSKDLDYFKSLPVYEQNTQKFIILDRELNAFKNALEKDKIIYVGTRLHAGILAMNYGVESVIVALDNRAREMAKDISLPVIERDQPHLISKWITGEKVFKNEIVTIPLENIATWKKQFAS